MLARSRVPFDIPAEVSSRMLSFGPTWRLVSVVIATPSVFGPFA